MLHSVWDGFQNPTIAAHTVSVFNQTEYRERFLGTIGRAAAVQTASTCSYATVTGHKVLPSSVVLGEQPKCGPLGRRRGAH